VLRYPLLGCRRLGTPAEVSRVTARRSLNGQHEIPSKVAAAMEAMVTTAAALCSGRGAIPRPQQMDDQ
jgi:hypothetical protein